MLKKKFATPPAPEHDASNRRATIKCLKEPPEQRCSDEIAGQRRVTPDDASGSDAAMPSERTDIPIAEFCAKVMKLLMKNCVYNKNKKESDLQRIVAFLMQHPSVKTTADLTSTVIGEFVATCEGKESRKVLR
jgi:hypothetical protein